MMRRHIASWLVLLGLVLSAPYAYADDPASRLARVRGALDADESNVKLWWYGWAGLFAASGGVQTGLSVLTDNAQFRAQQQVGATDSWLAVAGMALTPVKPGQRWDVITDAPVEQQLKWAEAELRHRARNERQVGGWLDHTLCVAVAVGSAAYLWLHEKQPGGAAMIGISDLVIGELQLWTVPHTAVHAVEALDTPE